MAESVKVIKCFSSGSSGGSMDMPPGFRFHPTDEELIVNYLREKVLNPNFKSIAIAELDMNKFEPWDLPSNAKMGEKEWYFFSQRDKKYPTGNRMNRATEAGFWKATGKDKEIYTEKGALLVGMKKTLVFYTGRAPEGNKTDWVMHEFRLEGQQQDPFTKSMMDSWVVCRVLHKNRNTSALLKIRNSVDQNESLIFYNNNQLINPCINNTVSTQITDDTSMVNPPEQDYLNDQEQAKLIDEPAAMQCKMDQQLSSQSLITASHDAVLSPETNTEISSMNLQNSNFNSSWFFNDPFQDLDSFFND